jgi:hypothetical protein
MLKALMWLKLYRNQAIRLLDFKQAKNDFFVFFACFRPYIQPSDVHIGWATLMPFPSIYWTNPKTNPWNVREKNWRIEGVENLSFFEWAILIFFFQKKILMKKSVNIYRVARMSWNFDDYPGFQPKTTPVQRYATQFRWSKIAKKIKTNLWKLPYGNKNNNT